MRLSPELKPFYIAKRQRGRPEARPVVNSFAGSYIKAREGKGKMNAQI